jgi:hypothetical protein
LNGVVQVDPLAQVAAGRALLFTVVEEPLMLILEADSSHCALAVQPVLTVSSVAFDTEALSVQPAPDPVPSTATSGAWSDKWVVVPPGNDAQLISLGPSNESDPAEIIAVPEKVHAGPPEKLHGLDEAGWKSTMEGATTKATAVNACTMRRWGIRAAFTGTPPVLWRRDMTS